MVSNQVKVKEANKLLYNKVAGDYERIDGRRSPELLYWLRGRLAEFAEGLTGQTKLLDIGCGSGFVARAGCGLFQRLYGIDISENILKETSQFTDGVICADADFLPFKDESIDMVVLFSALHHFYDFKVILNQIHRVLKTGGILYIDHDLSKGFAEKFRWLLKFYRMASRRKAKYMASGIEEEIYDLSEFHSDGIDNNELEHYIRELDFEIKESFDHWFGLSSLTNRIFNFRRYSKRSAPLLSIVARKNSPSQNCSEGC